LLKSSLNQVGARLEENIKSGFRSAGLIPSDRRAVFKRLPKQDGQVNATALNYSIKSMFEDARFGKDREPQKSRRKKLNVPAGQSVTNDELLDNDAAGTTSGMAKKRNIKKRRWMISSSEESTIDHQLSETSLMLVAEIIRHDQRKRK
jgi:hypothetical protein